MNRAYEHYFWNNNRWDGFQHRDGDVIICTSYRAGTTWIQRICSLLIFQSVDLPRPLTEISPWLELLAHPVTDIHALYEAQQHQRFIKSHTPFDGLPYQPESRYIFVGRDPRDILVSLFYHLQNSNPEVSESLLKQSGLDPVPPRGEAPASFSALLDEWLHHGCFPFEDNGWPYWSVFNHAQSFWDNRHMPNILLVHYDELQADLDASMQRVADFIGVEIDHLKRKELVEAVNFESMKANANQLVPDSDLGAWQNNEDFFRRGSSGQWSNLFNEADTENYIRRVSAKLTPELAAWLHQT